MSELIELGWELRDPHMIEYHASALDAYTQRESSPLQDAIIRRGRALARALRGDESSDLADEITHLKRIAEKSGSILLNFGLEGSARFNFP